MAEIGGTFSPAAEDPTALPERLARQPGESDSDYAKRVLEAQEAAARRAGAPLTRNPGESEDAFTERKRKANIAAAAAEDARTARDNAWNPAYLASLQQLMATDLQRKGWTMIGQPLVETKTVQDIGGGTREVQTGNYVVTINDGKPNGQVQQFTVKRLNQPGTTGTLGGWSVIEPPKDLKANANEGLYSNIRIDDDGTSWGLNNQTNGWEEIKGHTFSKDEKKGLDRYSSITVGYDGNFYGVDKDTNKSVKIEGATVPREPKYGRMVELNGKWYQEGDKPGLFAAVQGLPDDVEQPQIGDRRKQPGSDGYLYPQVYGQGGWKNDDVLPAVPYTAAAKKAEAELAERPKEGLTRQTVREGYKVQDIFKNGTWIEDPSVPRTRATPYEPTTVGAAADPKNKVIYRTDDTGKLVGTPNDNYQPEALGERVQYMQERAAAKYQELKAAADAKTITPEQAATQWDAWWNSNVEPYKVQLKQEQDRKYAEDQIKAQELQLKGVKQQTDNLTAAQAGAQNRVQNYISTLPYRVGPSFGKDVIENISNAYATGKAPGVISGDAFTFDAPNLDQMYTNAVAAGLKDISPVAAQIAGGQDVKLAQPIDLDSRLSKLSFQPGGFRPSATPAAAPVEAIPVPQRIDTPAAASPAQWGAGLDWNLGSQGWGNGIPEWIQQYLKTQSFMPA